MDRDGANEEMTGPGPAEVSRERVAAADSRLLPALWVATSALSVGLLLNFGLTIYDLTHRELFYDGDPVRMNGALAFLLALAAGVGQLVSTPIILAVLVWGTARLRVAGTRGRGVLDGVCVGLLLLCGLWYRSAPRDRVGGDLGWVHDAAAPGWVRLTAIVSPLLVVGAAALMIVLLRLFARAHRRAGNHRPTGP